jgi:hypothetical protein
MSAPFATVLNPVSTVWFNGAGAADTSTGNCYLLGGAPPTAGITNAFRFNTNTDTLSALSAIPVACDTTIMASSKTFGLGIGFGPSPNNGNKRLLFSYSTLTSSFAPVVPTSTLAGPSGQPAEIMP